MKKVFAIAILFALLFSISIVPCYASDSAEEMLSAEEMSVINAKFPREIQYIEEKAAIDLKSLSATEWVKVTEVVSPQLFNLNYDFNGLMSAFTGVFAQKEAENANKNRWSQEVIIHDYCVLTYRPLKTEILAKIPAAATYSRSYEITINPGYEKDGYSIGLGVSVSGEYSFAGPSTSDTLSNGEKTTHHVVIGVLSGEVWYKEYDLVTAFNTTRVKYYYVKESTKNAGAYTFEAHISRPTYAESAVTDEVFEFANELLLDEAVIADPALFVSTR